LSATESKTPDFEKMIRELESLVSTLEKGELSLEDSLKTFEKGIQLTQSCQSALQDAEQRVQILLNSKDKDGELQFETLEKE